MLAYPLVASVPLVSGILQIITYYYSGTLCNAILLKQLVSKLDIVINVENFIFSTFNFQFVFQFLILLIEVCIRLKNNWKVITETVIYTVCWWKRRNAVDPSADQPSSESLLLASYLNPYKGGSLLVLALLFVLLKVLRLLKYNVIDFVKIIFDCGLFVLPIYWAISSDDILAFIKLKCNQLKYRLGYLE
jgi:hypothetical protein